LGTVDSGCMVSTAMTGRKRGRPSKDTPARRAAILMALGKGVSRHGAAAIAGIHRDTLAEWEKKDPAFSDAVTRAMDISESVYVELIEEAAKKDWRAAAWMLERRHREDYGKRSRADVQVDVRRMVEDTAAEAGISPDELMAETDRLVREYSR